MEFARVALMPFVLPRGIAARRLFDCRNAGLTSFLLRTIRCDIMTDMTSRRKTLKRDWFDNQPGAWVMVMLPAVAGFFIGGPNLDTLWLLATWAVCYCVQFSAAHWFKAHFSRRYLPPMLTYAVALIVIGLPVSSSRVFHLPSSGLVWAMASEVANAATASTVATRSLRMRIPLPGRSVVPGQEPPG